MSSDPATKTSTTTTNVESSNMKQKPGVHVEDILHLTDLQDGKDSVTPHHNTLEKKQAAELAQVWGTDSSGSSASSSNTESKVEESKKENENLLDMFLAPSTKSNDSSNPE
mmetsp:Transcript_15270/g.21461  ORF Transcript_15270/g.21461 Transcript_15270/m.21461 type:complete len:111 (-) Transcript_15270:361-693(-)|eukprot:CAMPEP_0184484728 /NCGR_PEP_ID=MMETSP0113_2-20130426/6403_1 /TAXON_ID=91329 /ORGANISM="Norrisiella sphaerica, Strain BC52" /LENGTH=110 /DNA_ID=CAMNT_0026865837 /DNA_START=180 /DNA_END=512 /DNA_ORIENTATION=+